MISLLNLAFFLASIAISQTAKPIGDLRYRWGLWLALDSGWVSVWLMISAFAETKAGGFASGCVLAVLAAMAGAGCLGVLWRRKFGPILLAITASTLFLILPIFYWTAPGHLFVLTVRAEPLSVSQALRAVPGLANFACFVFTFLYFRKRWNLMAN